LTAYAEVHIAAPADVTRRFQQLLAERDVDALVALYEPKAAFRTQDGSVRGHGAIRRALEGFVALNPNMTGEIQKVVEAGETALVINRWQLDGTAPGGDPIRLAGVSADVMCRQADGSWRVLIDDPWGGGGA
jgi:ketosteroid isomerase-like protein